MEEIPYQPSCHYVFSLSLQLVTQYKRIEFLNIQQFLKQLEYYVYHNNDLIQDIFDLFFEKVPEQETQVEGKKK